MQQNDMHISFVIFFRIGFLSVELQPTPHHTTPHHTKRNQHEHHTLNTQHTTPHLPLLLFLLFFFFQLCLCTLCNTHVQTHAHMHTAQRRYHKPHAQNIRTHTTHPALLTL